MIDSLDESTLLLRLAEDAAADPIDVAVVRGDRTRLTGGSTSAADSRLNLDTSIMPGIYVVQLKSRAQGGNAGYYVRVDYTATDKSGPGPSAAGCSHANQVIRGFGMIYNQDAPLRSRLGCPTENERGVWMADQVFQRGLMLWREDTQQIIVLRGTDRQTSLGATVHPDRFMEGDPEGAAIIPPPGLEAPKRGFGRLWRDNPGINQALAWGLRSERGFQGAVQAFDRGLMIWTGDDERLTWVIYDNGETLVLRDLFVG